MFPHLKNLSYEDRLSELGLWSLKERRNRADIILVFKMVKQMSSVPCNRSFKRAEDSITRGHSQKLVKESCHCDCRLHFFSDRGVALESVISAYSAINHYQAQQGARYGEHGRAARSREALITSDGPGVRSVRSAATGCDRTH